MVTKGTDISPDPADNFLLAMAEVGDADFLVAGDRSGILRFRKHRSTQIVSVRQMVDELKVRAFGFATIDRIVPQTARAIRC